ncbi:MAG: GNAT family N-acetyltransferase [Clostridiales bacterium]|nr:GNAT family N-acetyltransferase [Clostridiales bacterium]
MEIRRFEKKDAEALAKIVQRNFLEVNIKDYTKDKMERLAAQYSEKKILEIAGLSHMYTAVAGNGKILGCGAISYNWGKKGESLLMTIFVDPDFHSLGIGSSIVQRLEDDEIYKKTRKTQVPASITACEFYKKMCYDYKEGKKEVDAQGHYIMEKYR